jgi:hypothetical protein
VYLQIFHVVIIREYEPTKWCFSVGPDQGLWTKNFEQKEVKADPELQRQAQIPSLAFLVGCNQMFGPATCSVEQEAVQIKTELGDAEYSIMGSFKCDDFPDQVWGKF